MHTTTITPALPVVSLKLDRLLYVMALIEAALIAAFFLLRKPPSH